MQQIPDTAGGLSGFIAWLLWQVYVYFPFEGTWDWLLLIVFLAVLTRCIMIPVWWRLVNRAKQAGHSAAPRRTMDILTGIDFVWPWLVILLFNTAAGRTFLEGRSGRPLEVARVVYWCSLLCHSGAAAGSIFWGGKLVDSRKKFLLKDYLVLTISLLFFYSLISLAAHLFYWHWFVASLAVFLVFGVTTVIHSVTIVYLSHVYGLGV